MTLQSAPAGFDPGAGSRFPAWLTDLPVRLGGLLDTLGAQGRSAFLPILPLPPESIDMPFSFECPYCGEVISESDDLEYILLHKLCPECEASFDDDELEELLPEEDLIDDNGDYGYGEGDDDDDDEDSSDADLDDGLVDDVDEDDDSDSDSDSDSDEDADDDEEP